MSAIWKLSRLLHLILFLVSQLGQNRSINTMIVPFLSCGDLLGYDDDLDADAS
jgi:hypothetical protein